MMPVPGSDYLRVLDACLDRASEGLRTVEDLLRFVSADARGREKVRSIRQRLWECMNGFPPGRLLAARESVSDVGRASPQRPETGSIRDVFRRNLHRTQESLRTIEEILRGFDPEAASRMAGLRFECYDVEKEYYATVARIDKRGLLEFSLYVVTGREQSKGRDYFEVVRRAIEGGAGAIQFRAKELDAGELLATARELRAMTAEAGATFIVNDHVDVALASGADGVHLGQEDLPIREARKIAGPDLIIGLSTHSLDQAVEGETNGADYVNVGPIFATGTKVYGGGPVGLELIARVKARVGIPITCMGGINRDNVERVVAAGADRVAVVSAVAGADDIAEAARDLVERIRLARVKRAPIEGGRTGE